MQPSLINLLFITLLAATAAIVGGHPGDRLAAACFSVNGIMLALSAWAIWTYVAVRNHLLAENTDPRLLSGIARVWLYVAIGFGLAIVAGVLNVYAEYAPWVFWSPLVSL